jgi:hypothetical protein
MANGKFTAEQMANAIISADGILAKAARDLGCSRQTVHNYVNKFVTVREAYEEANDKFIDDAEEQLQRHVKRGSLPAVMFVLKTKGKHRGYVERQEYQHEGDITINVKYGKNGANGQSS